MPSLASGQFTQEDPIGIAGGLDLYGYAGGDPVNFSDPFGLCPRHLTGRPCQTPLRDGRLRIRSDIFSVFGRSSQRASGLHQGVDLLAPIGSEVMAADAGTVALAGSSSTWGNFVVLGHQDDSGATVSYTAYMHLSGVDVAKGAAVDAGSVIGATGDTGNARGDPPHLHFEVWTDLSAASRGTGLNFRLDPVMHLPWENR